MFFVINRFLIQEEPKLTEIPKDSGVAANTNPLVRMSLDEALDKINVLEASTKTLDIQLKQVTEERNQANSVTMRKYALLFSTRLVV